MTGADLQWSDVEVNIAGGLNEDIDERVLPPGQLAAVRNCEFTSKTGSLRKRPGGVIVSPPPSGVALSRLVAHDTKNQLLGVDLVGSASVSPALYAPLDAPVDGAQSVPTRRLGFATNALVKRSPIAADLQSDIICDGAFVRTSTEFGYMVYGSVYKQTGNISIKVVQVDCGSGAYDTRNTVLEVEVPYNSGDIGTAYWVRAAACLDRYVLITWQFFSLGNPNQIHGVIVDCGDSPQPTASALTSIIAAADTGFFYHDTAESLFDTDFPSSPNWLLVYRDAGTITIQRLNSAMTAMWTQDFTAFYEPEAVSILETDGVTWVNWFDADSAVPDPSLHWLYATIETETGNVNLAPTVWCDGGDINAAQLRGKALCSGIAFRGGLSDVELFHSQAYTDGLVASWGGITPPTGVSVTPLTRWRLARDDGSQGGLREKRGIVLFSKPWADATADWFDAWCGVPFVRELSEVSAVEVAPGYAGYDLTGALMRFCDAGGGEATKALAIMIGSTANSKLQNPLVSSSAPIADASEVLVGVPSSVTYGAYVATNVSSARLGRRAVLNVRYVPTEAKSGPWDVVVRTDESSDHPQGYGRYLSERFGQSVHMPGGLLTQWDGDRHHEDGFIVQPSISVQRIDSGGGGAGVWPASWAGHKLFFQAVYETVTSGGERVKSATSAVLSVTFENPAPPSVHDVFKIYLEPQTVSMRTYGGGGQEHDAPRTIVTLYCSDTVDSPELHRLYTFGEANWDSFVSTPDDLAPLEFTLTTNTQLPSSALEVIYTDSGELDNDMVVGGCSAQAVHKDRLWVGGCDEPELIWYSKERVDGRALEFSIGQQVRIPGKSVIGLASLDDSLIVFCESSVYAISGDGPNSTGDASSGFFTVVPISTTVGCNSASSIQTVPQGVIFKSAAGLAMLDRARSISLLANVVDSSNLTFAPIASVAEPSVQQARFIYRTPGDDYSEALVYDWSIGLWGVWRFNYTEGAVIDMQRLGRDLFILTADGSIHREDSATFADSGNAYRQYIKLGELNFGRALGYKRVGHMGILAAPVAWADRSASPDTFPSGLRATVNLNYSSGTFYTQSEWSAYELGGIAAQDGIVLLRTHIGKKQPSIGVILEEQAPGNALLSTATTPINTVGANVLKIKIQASASFSTWTVTSSATLSKSALLTDIQARIVTAGWSDYLKASLVGNRLLLETIKKASDTGLGSYLAIDAVAAGSTLNTPLGFNVAGEVGSPIVREEDQSGLVFQVLNFEVGQAPGPRRVAAAQSR